jgi:hypothetical protein
MTLAIIIRQNQNEVNSKEAAKIVKAVKKEYPDAKATVYRNDNAEEVIENGIPDVPEDHFITFSTHDVNNKVWAECDCDLSSVGFGYVIALN